jgi:D-alanyl-D-alanine carboxypeptidase
MLGSYYKVPVVIPDFMAMQLDPKELERYVGEYTSQQIDVKMTISHSNNRLYGKPTGQPAFILTPVRKDVFKFDTFGLTMEFRPDAREVTITQAGDSYLFTK